MLSNVTTPLLGVVDTAVVGQIPSPVHIGAVAVGSLIFSFIFWAFGFLRMGTTGLTAQALGADDQAELRATLLRALFLGGVVGIGLVAAQLPLRELAFALLDGSAAVELRARAYFDIRIWAAPATLMNYALLGFYIGMGRARIALVLQLVLNLTNMALDSLFVLGFEWGVEGVALGTVIAEYGALLAGLGLAFRDLPRVRGAGVFALRELRRTLGVNGDIMVRSLALLTVFLWFMADGAAQGDEILAANSVLMQFISVSAFFLDGLAFSAEALVGRSVGAGDRAAFLLTVRRTTAWAFGVAAGLTVVLFVFGPFFIDGLSSDPGVRDTARDYLPWAAAAPLAGVACFQLDGIFIGATKTAEMRNAMLASLAIFIGAYWALTPFQNHGLWASLFVHYLARTVSLLAYWRRVPPSP